MAELGTAVERLTRAIERLEIAAARRLSADQRLVGELARERSERQRLDRLNGTVGGRLDGAIERIRAVLES